MRHLLSPLIAFSFLAAVLIVSADTVGARRAEDFAPAGGASSSASVDTTRKGLAQHRALMRKARQEWKDRAEGKRSSARSASSLPAGSFRYKIYDGTGIGEGQEALLYFYTPWSRTCQEMDKILRSWSEEKPFLIPLYRMDYDTQTGLRNIYGVRYSNTYVLVDGSGKKTRLLDSPHTSLLQLLLWGG